jgi:phosphoglycolate phosphatase-like HAD superfamily hydrolase
MSVQEIPKDQIDVVAIDWDMTAVDSRGKLRQNLAIAHEFGNNITEDEVRVHWNESAGFSDLMARLTNGADPREVMSVVTRDYNKPEFAKQRFPFTQPFIDRMRNKGFGLAVVTNLKRELLEADAKTLAIDLSDFDFCQAQDDYEFKKPDGRVFAPLLGHFGIVASQLCYIGDEIKDFCAAQSTEAEFIGVTTGMTTAKEFDIVGAMYVTNLGGVR